MDQHISAEGRAVIKEAGEASTYQEAIKMVKDFAITEQTKTPKPAETSTMKKDNNSSKPAESSTSKNGNKRKPVTKQTPKKTTRSCGSHDCDVCLQYATHPAYEDSEYCKYAGKATQAESDVVITGLVAEIRRKQQAARVIINANKDGFLARCLAKKKPKQLNALFAKHWPAKGVASSRFFEAPGLEQEVYRKLESSEKNDMLLVPQLEMEILKRSPFEFLRLTYYRVYRDIDDWYPHDTAMLIPRWEAGGYYVLGSAGLIVNHGQRLGQPVEESLDALHKQRGCAPHWARLWLRSVDLIMTFILDCVTELTTSLPQSEACSQWDELVRNDFPGGFAAEDIPTFIKIHASNPTPHPSSLFPTIDKYLEVRSQELFALETDLPYLHRQVEIRSRVLRCEVDDGTEDVSGGHLLATEIAAKVQAHVLKALWQQLCVAFDKHMPTFRRGDTPHEEFGSELRRVRRHTKELISLRMYTIQELHFRPLVSAAMLGPEGDLPSPCKIFKLKSCAEVKEKEELSYRISRLFDFRTNGVHWELFRIGQLLQNSKKAKKAASRSVQLDLMELNLLLQLWEWTQGCSWGIDIAKDTISKDVRQPLYSLARSVHLELEDDYIEEIQDDFVDLKVVQHSGTKDKRWLERSDARQLEFREMIESAHEGYKEMLEELSNERFWIDQVVEWLALDFDDRSWISEEERKRILEPPVAPKRRSTELGEWKPLPQTPEDRFVIPRTKADQIKEELERRSTSPEPAEEQPVQQVEEVDKTPVVIEISRKLLFIVPHLFKGTEMPVGTVDVFDIEKLMGEAGFKMEQAEGSRVRFRHNDGRSTVVHANHGASIYRPYQLLTIGRNLHRRFGWMRETFKGRG